VLQYSVLQVNEGRDQPSISVLMAGRNCEDFIGAAMDSILGQSMGDFELLMVDDGSTDGTPAILAKYAQADSRVRVYTRPPSGLAASLNFCIEQARGRYLARMDADDICLPDRLLLQFRFLERHADHVAIGTWVRTFGGFTEVWKFPVTPAHAAVRLFFGPPIAHPTAMIRASTIAANAFRYDESCKAAQDYDFWDRLSSHGLLGNLPVVALNYRVHPLQVSSKGRVEQKRVTLMVATRRWASELGFSPDESTAMWLLGFGSRRQRNAADVVRFACHLVARASRDPRLSLFHATGKAIKILLQLPLR
jgi:glycosyltransferase involved in cell wall biosynthesis